jgi:hypothetical protein
VPAGRLVRQPLEDGQLTISSAAASLTYLARCTLVTAAAAATDAARTAAAPSVRMMVGTGDYKNLEDVRSDCPWPSVGGSPGVRSPRQLSSLRVPISSPPPVATAAGTDLTEAKRDPVQAFGYPVPTWVRNRRWNEIRLE